MTDPVSMAELFPESQPIAREAPAAERAPFEKIPAKMAVYLLTAPDEGQGGGERPVLLATVGDLRSALRRRLSEPVPAQGAENAGPTRTKRIDYGRLCTRVHYRIVHSPLAANWHYAQAARVLFPRTYRELVAFRPTWWIGLERDVVAARFPKLRRTQALDDASLVYAGPIRDKSAAGKLIELVEDLFDLCRYHHILVQAPLGKACAYKEMGKCPAPCDGSVPLEWYYAAIRAAFTFITGESRAAFFAAQQAAMRAAAAKLAFEKAQKIKQRLDRAGEVSNEAYAHLASLERFAFLTLQPGQGKPFVEPFLLHGGVIRPLPQLHKKTLAAEAGKLFEAIRAAATTPVVPPIDERGVEEMGLIAYHLFRNEDAGVYLPLGTITGPEQIVAAAEQIMNRKAAPKPLAEQSSDTGASVAGPQRGPEE
jgi:excinuclease UvrABC nuclease subunit